ncbi:hypothetical protein N7495_007830 [Penicillium taxi]|uniref:uncharacterized protein n=1 Tax=Penicillium taxi TaxID=168475 RepID=UPI002545490D|nr:uncharacterized protein N7495_007830 [Penicillium taxi]KAJ5887789.1 hypothetical protein N7495_007830 [Penicillium taxi]
MSTQKAVVIISPKVAGLVTDRPIPKLRDDYILVKTVAVGLNPTDWKHIEYVASPGVLVGCDYAGTVEATGKDVHESFKKGDRICGFVHGCNDVQPEDGGFAQYIVAKAGVQMKIPDHLSFQEAATLGVGITTVGQGLYQSLKLALPTDPTWDKTPLLIYGGSTATGTLAIQFAKYSGYTVITTCSPRNVNLVRSVGADHVFDYNVPESPAQIRKLTNDNLKLVFDCISLEDSTAFCEGAISTGGGDYSTLLPVKIARKNVRSRSTLGYTALGEDFSVGPTPYPAKSEDFDHAQLFTVMSEWFLANRKVKVHPPKVGKDGLKGVLEGLKLMKDGKVSGEKLVYNVDETP